jgi:hypothetical protein
MAMYLLDPWLKAAYCFHGNESFRISNGPTSSSDKTPMPCLSWINLKLNFPFSIDFCDEHVDLYNHMSTLKPPQCTLDVRRS